MLIESDRAFTIERRIRSGEDVALTFARCDRFTSRGVNAEIFYPLRKVRPDSDKSDAEEEKKVRHMKRKQKN